MTIKRCYICGLEKDESEFSKDKSRKDGLSNKCKSCSSIRYKHWSYKHREQLTNYRTEWRKLNPEKQREYSRTTKNNRNNQLDSYKTDCVKCGESRRYVIDFHHINNDDKSFSVSLAKQKGYSAKHILPELSKCVCLCRNCHTEFHYLYGNVPTKPIDSLREYIGCDPQPITINDGEVIV